MKTLATPYNHSVLHQLKKLSHREFASKGMGYGKVILVGEHAVVYGAQAIALPVKDLWIETQVKKNKGPKTQIIFDSEEGEAPSAEAQEAIAETCVHARSLLDIPEDSLLISVKSNLWIGAGLGSSAALCVSLLKALATEYQRNVDLSSLRVFANQLESRFHGKPSGLDTVTSLSDCAVLFQKGKEPEFLLSLEATDKKLHWVILDSGLRASTIHMVEKVRPFFAGTSGEKLVAEMSQLARAAGNFYQQKDEQNLGKIMVENQRHLESFHIVPPMMIDMIEQLKSFGVKGVKITGAGGGGCLLALLPQDFLFCRQQIQKTFSSTHFFET